MRRRTTTFRVTLAADAVLAARLVAYMQRHDLSETAAIKQLIAIAVQADDAAKS